MKKVLVMLLILMGFLSNGGLYALSSPFKQVKRLWQCRPSAAKQNNCTKKEIATTKKWLIGTAAAAITAVLAVVGVKAYDVWQEKQAAAAGGQREAFTRSIDIINEINPPEDPHAQAVQQELKARLGNLGYQQPGNY